MLQREEGPSGATRTLLCVQPDTETQRSIEHALSGYTIAFASSGLEAIHSLHGHVFDSYILDYRLPDWSGIEFCQDIRKTDPRAPICFYSSDNSQQCRSQAIRAGANAFLRRPEDIGYLRATVHTLIEGAIIESLHATLAEEHAVQNELERRAAVAAAGLDRARVMTAKAVERMARAQAAKAFMEAGGTRANFERWWTDVFSRVANRERNAD